MKKLMCILVVAISVTGCAKLTLLKHPITGDVEKCEVTVASQLLTGAYIGGIEHDKCVDAFKRVGYEEFKK